MTKTIENATKKTTVTASLKTAIETFEFIEAYRGDEAWFKFIAIASTYARQYLKENAPSAVAIFYGGEMFCDCPWKLFTSIGMELWAFPTAINALCAWFALHLYKLDLVDFPSEQETLSKLNDIIEAFGDRSFTVPATLLDLGIKWDYDNIPF